jgi:hypothetical protein
VRLREPFAQETYMREMRGQRKTSFVPYLLALLCTLAVTASARADERSYRIRGVRPEAHLSIGGHGDIGAGFRIDIPIVPEGFIGRGRDDFALSPGLDLQFFDFGDHDCGGRGPKPGRGECRDGDGVVVIPQLAAQWNFYFPRHAWSIAPELGIAVVIGDWDGHDDVRVQPLAAFVARKHFAGRTALVLRGGWPSGFQIGIAF